MPGLDYLSESYDPREDNYYNSGLKQLAIDTALPWAAKHAATGYGKLIAPKESILNTYKSGLSGLKSMDPSLRVMAKVQNAEFVTARNAVLGARINQMKATGLARTLGRYGKVASVAGAVMMGWQLGKGLLSLSDAFNDTPEGIAARRRKSLYNGGEEYFDSRAAFTQRQRALQVIHNSQMSTRAAFQDEASFLHY